MLIRRSSIPRVSPKAREYVNRVLEYGFHNCSSPGMVKRLEREFAAKFGQKFGIAHLPGKDGFEQKSERVVGESLRMAMNREACAIAQARV